MLLHFLEPQEHPFCEVQRKWLQGAHYTTCSFTGQTSVIHLTTLSVLLLIINNNNDDNTSNGCHGSGIVCFTHIKSWFYSLHPMS